MKRLRLYIVGAGGFGREVAQWARMIPCAAREWELAGFLDDRANVLTGKSCALRIIGSVEEHIVLEDDRFVVAIGDPKAKLHYARLIASRGARFVNLVHPTAIIGDSCRIGVGCIFCPGAIVTDNASIGDFVTLNLHATVGHDAEVGRGCTLSAHADATGYSTLGEGVFLGSHAVVLPKGKIGDFAMVGAGSVVVKSLRAGVTGFGLPVREI